MAALAETPIFDLHIPDAPHQLVVISFTARERMSRCYTFDLRVAGPAIDAEAIDRLYVGRAAHLRFGGEGDRERWAHGVIRRMEAEGLAADTDDRHGYRLRFVPMLRLLGEKKNSRIFQDTTVPDIARAVLRASGVALEARLSREYRPRVYCVQHQETDKAFVERLLEEEGIYYFFEHPARNDARETLVLADEPSACKPVPGGSALRVAPKGGMKAADDDDLARFRLRRRVEPGSVLLKDFDFTRPSFDLHGSAGSSEKAAIPRPAASAAGAVEAPTGMLDPDAIEQYHHHAELEVSAVEDGAARTRLEQHRRKLWVGIGEGRSTRLLPGFTIDVQDAQIDKHPGSYTIFDVGHEGHNPRALRAGGEIPFTYRNRFQCVPSKTPFRPRPPRPRTQQVLETATVVGPPGEEIHTDVHGRIKVQFHWDREGKRDDHSSCWIRVMQPWAGPGWGFQFIPRIGMEVMVAFLAGDTDRPMVLGSVYNAEHPPPFPLPAHKTRSGIRTQSSPGGEGYNEISFEDLRGEERIFVHAEKHLTETIGVDHATKVGNDRRSVVEGDHDTSVGGDMTLAVAGAKRDQVSADRSEGTSGSVSVIVGGNHDEIVGGHRSVEVTGASKARFKNSASAHVDLEASLTAVGGLSVNVGAESASSGALHARGSWFVGADENVVVNAIGSVSLICGTSVIKLTPDHIEISAKAILVKGEDEAVMRGGQSMVELAGEAKIKGPAARMFGQGASVEASTNAYVKGAKVKLNEREGDPPKATDTTEKPETRTLSLKLTDGNFTAYGGKPYEMTVDGVRYSGTTGGDGSIAQEVPASATKAHLLLWEGAAPSGAHHVWNLVIAEPPGASTLDGARSRLTNLGYKTGLGEEADPVTTRAISQFQRDHDIEPTGSLDGATAAKLQEIHGH